MAASAVAIDLFIAVAIAIVIASAVAIATPVCPTFVNCVRVPCGCARVSVCAEIARAIVTAIAIATVPQ